MEQAIPELIELQFAAERRIRAEETRKAASAELRERVVDAYEAGIPVSRIAREARISRQAAYEMLGLRRLSRPRTLKSSRAGRADPRPAVSRLWGVQIPVRAIRPPGRGPLSRFAQLCGLLLTIVDV